MRRASYEPPAWLAWGMLSPFAARGLYPHPEGALLGAALWALTIGVWMLWVERRRSASDWWGRFCEGLFGAVLALALLSAVS